MSGPASGENRVVEDEARLLAEAGHEVEVWSPSVARLQAPNGLKLAATAVWSVSAVGEIIRRVADNRIDVVHFHNLFPMISPIPITAARRAGASVVMTLHNHRLLCLPATLVRNGRTCEDCVGKVPWRGVAHRCYRGSLRASASLATSITFHRWRRTYNDVDLFLPVSRYVYEKHAQVGFPAARMLVKPNFAWPSVLREGPGRFFLFLGRVAPEKGIDRLVRLWPRVAGPLRVVGDGPLLPQLRGVASKAVEFTGYRPASDVPQQFAGARALIVPSLSDASPRAVLEAYASGVPVVATGVGGLPELIRPEVSGLLLPELDDAWPGVITRLKDDALSTRLGTGAYALWKAEFSPTKALRNLEGAYRLALEHRSGLSHSR